MNIDFHQAIEAAGVTASVFLIIFMIRKGWKMYYVMLAAVAVLALTGGSGALEVAGTFYRSLTSYTAFYLVSMVLAITILGSLHQEVGAMNRLVDGLRYLIRDPRALIMVFPAAISLFSTVPGGAIISAPMVEKTGKDLNMPPVELAMSNMVYRHLVVLITPFNAGIILASGISGISIGSYLSFTIPVIAIVFIIATVILLIRYPKPAKEDWPVQKPSGSNSPLFDVFGSAAPYAVAIILGLALGIFFPLAMLAGIVICFFLYLPEQHRGETLRKRLKAIVRGFNWPLALSTLTIVLYKDFILEADAFLDAVTLLVDRGLPLTVLIVVLPFITGFITGNNAAALGVALPILMPFLGSDMHSVRYFGIIYLSSYAGYFGSPVHLCTYVTNEYFKTPLYALIKGVNVYAIIMLGVGLVLSLFY